MCADACKERQAFRATDHIEYRDTKIIQSKESGLILISKSAADCVHTKGFLDPVALRGLGVSLQRQGAQYLLNNSFGAVFLLYMYSTRHRTTPFRSSTC